MLKGWGVMKGYMWHSRVEIEHYFDAYLLALLRSKRSCVELPLRAGLIRAGETHQYLPRLHSACEPRT